MKLVFFLIRNSKSIFLNALIMALCIAAGVGSGLIILSATGDHGPLMLCLLLYIGLAGSIESCLININNPQLHLRAISWNLTFLIDIIIFSLLCFFIFSVYALAVFAVLFILFAFVFCIQEYFYMFMLNKFYIGMTIASRPGVFFDCFNRRRVKDSAYIIGCKEIFFKILPEKSYAFNCKYDFSEMRVPNRCAIIEAEAKQFSQEGFKCVVEKIAKASLYYKYHFLGASQKGAAAQFYILFYTKNFLKYYNEVENIIKNSGYSVLSKDMIPVSSVDDLPEIEHKIAACAEDTLWQKDGFYFFNMATKFADKITNSLYVELVFTFKTREDRTEAKKLLCSKNYYFCEEWYEHDSYFISFTRNIVFSERVDGFYKRLASMNRYYSLFIFYKKGNYSLSLKNLDTRLNRIKALIEKEQNMIYDNIKEKMPFKEYTPLSKTQYFNPNTNILTMSLKDMELAFAKKEEFSLELVEKTIQDETKLYIEGEYKLLSWQPLSGESFFSLLYVEEK